MKCPECGNDDPERIIGYQYNWTEPEAYDDVSEWRCGKCGTRWGRWTGRVLQPGESEPRYGRTTTREQEQSE